MPVRLSFSPRAVAFSVVYEAPKLLAALAASPSLVDCHVRTTGCFDVKWPSSALTPTRLYSTWEPSQGAPYHYTLLTCVKAVVRTTALLTRPHTHPLNMTLQERPRTNRQTNYHKHSTQQSIFLSLCCKRLQKLRVVKDEVVERSSLRCIHRTRSERASCRRA